MEIGINTYYIILRPEEDVFKSGVNLLTILNKLTLLGKTKITPHVNNIPLIEELDTSKCYIYWDIFLATSACEGKIREAMNDASTICQIEIYKVARNNLLENEQ